MTTLIPTRDIAWRPSFLAAIVVAGSLVFVAASKVETVQRTYAVTELGNEEERLAEEQRRLRAELARLRSPGQLELLAAGLGLRSPAAGQVIVVADDPMALQAALNPTSAPQAVQGSLARSGAPRHD